MHSELRPQRHNSDTTDGEKIGKVAYKAQAWRRGVTNEKSWNPTNRRFMLGKDPSKFLSDKAFSTVNKGITMENTFDALAHEADTSKDINQTTERERKSSK